MDLCIPGCHSDSRQERIHPKGWRAQSLDLQTKTERLIGGEKSKHPVRLTHIDSDAVRRSACGRRRGVSPAFQALAVMESEVLEHEPEVTELEVKLV